VSSLLDAIPYARFLGVRVERCGDAFETVLPFRDDLVGNTVLRALHGGVLGALLELTALLRLLEEEVGQVPRPINFTVDYLRAAGPTTTRGRAEIFKLGRRVAVVHALAWQDDPARPVAAGNGKFLL